MFLDNGPPDYLLHAFYFSSHSNSGSESSYFCQNISWCHAWVLAYNLWWRSQQLLGKNLVLHNTVAVFSSYYIYLLQSFLLPILRYYLDVFTCTPLHNYNNPKKLFDIATRHLLVKWRSCMTTIRPLKKFKSICVIYTAACWSNGPNQKVDISQLMCWFPPSGL